ncbi:hypothetical protein DL93DRAFT_2078317 [Clavulina sp. PMI_390]|nr:hypothetical protein DL93DRAFT_2078317 [Clavulina sp. PMI_390]
MSSNDHENLISLLTAAFINSLAVYNPAGSNQGGTNGFNLNATLNNFWSTKSRIIVFYNDDASVAVNNFLWPNVSNQTVSPAITSPRPDASSFTAVQSALDSELPFTGSTAFVLQCQVSPDAGVITSALAGGSYNSLGALAGAGNSQIVGWLKGWGPDVGINIVIADWIQSYPTLIPTIIAMNGVDFPASIFGSLANIEKTGKSSGPPPNSAMC